MAGVFSDSSGKRTVREIWNTPLLRYLHSTYGIRYRYMGLTGTDLIDVRLWKDMVDDVVSFEVPNKKGSGQDRRKYITELRRNLITYGIPGRAYYGPMEEVVMLRKDYDNQPYQQDRMVTLYNLDFCDEIGSSIETLEQGKQLWRYEVIRRILRDQCDVMSEDDENMFIFMVTIRDQMRVDLLKSFLNPENIFHSTQKYISSCGGLDRLPDSGIVLGDHTWALKAFLHDLLRNYFGNPGISALFFPVVKYTGQPVRLKDKSILQSPMLHYMVLCRFEEYENPQCVSMPTEYLSATASIRAHEEGRLIWEPEPGENVTPKGQPSPIQWFQQYEADFLQIA